MSRDTKRTGRVLKLALYMYQHGGTRKDLVDFSGTTPSIFDADLRIIRDAGIPVKCENHIYRIPEWPDIMKLNDEDDPRQECFSPNIFRKWYRPLERDGHWYVGRADKKDPKGTLIGPVQITGRNWYMAAVEEAQKRNNEIKEKRRAVVDKMLACGWTHDRVRKFQEEALELVRAELENSEYVEEEV